jgi:hypothetical protein
MVRKERYIGLGLDTDTAPDKRKTDVYWDAENIVIVNNGRSLSIKPIKGEVKILDFPETTMNNRKVLGTCIFMNTIYVFTWHTEFNVYVPETWNEIYKIDSSNVITRIARGQWDIESTYKLDIKANYENENIIKLYFIDGVNPLRYVNVLESSVEMHSIVDEVTLDIPSVALEVTGGGLTAGCVQYVYNLYNLYGSQSVLSPASELLSLAGFYRGFESGELTSYKVKIDIANINLATAYDAIKVYSIHYQELNQSPKVTLIYDQEVNNQTLSLYDDGNRSIATLAVSDLLAISPLPLIPNTLEIKRDRLFIANYTQPEFNPAIDMRAYSYADSNTSFYIKNDGVVEFYSSYVAVATDNDCINPDYDTYNKKYNSTDFGGTGLNIEYSFTSQALVTNVTPPKSFKRFEIYRIGIILLNAVGQRSPVKWVADFRVPTTFATNHVIGLTTNLTSAGVTALEALGVTNYQITIVERKPEDRTILSQGFIVPGCKYTTTGYDNVTGFTHPYYIAKDIVPSDSFDVGAYIGHNYYAGIDWEEDTGKPYPLKQDSVAFFYSTDSAFEANTVTPTKVRILGEAVRELETGGTFLMFHDTEVLGYQEYLSPVKAEPYWGARTEVQFPYHVMDQSHTISDAATGIYVYTVAQAKPYNSIYLNSYSSTTNVVNLESAILLKGGASGLLTTGTPVTNSISKSDMIDTVTDKMPTSYYARHMDSIALNFGNTTWHKTSVDYDKFDAFDIYNSGTFYRGLPLVELLRDVNNQYGGATYETKQRNEYLPLGELRDITTTPNDEYIGDIWLGTLSINRSDGLDFKATGQMGIYEYIDVAYIENNHNVYARSDSLYNITEGYFGNIDPRLYRLADLHKLTSVYNQVPNVFKNYPVQFTAQDINLYPLTVASSDSKAAGELYDSWLKFNPLNIKHMEGQYGPIAKLHNLNGDLLCIQSSGIAFVEVEPRVQTLDADGLNIQLGIGNVLYNHRYLITNSGTTRKQTVCEDGKGLYYYDDNLNLICTLHDGKLSTLKTVKGILDVYTSGPHSATYYNKMDHIYFQYDEFTLVYDILLQKFISKNTLLNSNKFLLPLNQELLQLDDTGTITSLYQQYVGATKDSSITYLICPDPTNEKVFHNLEYRLVGSDFTNIEVSNDRSISGATIPDTKTKFDIHRVHLPRVENSRERWRGIYIFVKLENDFDYSLDDLVVMYNIKG